MELTSAWKQKYDERVAAGLCYLCPEGGAGPQKAGPTYEKLCDACGLDRLERQRQSNKHGERSAMASTDPVGRLIHDLRAEDRAL